MITKKITTLLLAVAFTFATIQAQETTKTSCDKSKTEQKSCDKSKTDAKSCDKSAPAGKTCCDSKSAEGKSCSGSASAYVKKVNPKDFMSYADRFPAENIVDIRTKEEVKATGMVPNAKNIDYQSRDFKEKINALDKEAAIMIYCNSGKRTSEAIALLQSWGFKKIYEMEGGYKAYTTTFPKSK